jgi:hypothetical protein
LEANGINVSYDKPVMCSPDREYKVSIEGISSMKECDVFILSCDDPLQRSSQILPNNAVVVVIVSMGLPSWRVGDLAVKHAK